MASNAPETTDSVEREIVDLHAFFEGWFRANVPDTDETYSRLSSSLAEEFTMRPPSGELRTRAQLLVGLRAMRGRWSEDPSAAIEIRNVRVVAADGQSVVARYEEWQTQDDGVRGRASTAVFRRDDAAPHGLVWVWLHESWLPNQH